MNSKELSASVFDLLKKDNSIDSIESIDNKNKMEFTIEDVFVNLRLISKIEPGNRLINDSEKYINIDNSYFPSITRWFKGTNRNMNLQFVNFILTKAFEFNDELLNTNNDESVRKLLRLNTDLKGASNGLLNLKQTYKADKLIQSEIDVMVDNIRSKLDLNSKKISFS